MLSAMAIAQKIRPIPSDEGAAKDLTSAAQPADSQTIPSIEEDGSEIDIPQTTPVGLTASAEWLDWQAHRQGLDYAVFSGTNSFAPLAQESLLLPRNGGMRAELGYRFPSLWQIGWTYTNFFSESQSTATRTAFPNSMLTVTEASILTTSMPYKPNAICE